MGNPGPSVRLRSSARTSIGQVRENNEDNIHLWARDSFVLAVVADGMGGAAAGEEASRLAVEAVKASLTQRAGPGLETLGDVQLSEQLRATVQDANNRIVAKALSAPEFRGMGTTVTLVFVRGMSAIFAHVGDSRAYLVDGDDGHILQVTSDHSFVEALLTAGHITREQADEHPMRNVLYRALGQTEDVDVDLYYKRLRVGDRLVLCSDGLTRHVKPEEIAQLSLDSGNPDTVSQQLIDLANERGGEDNISVIIISVEASSPTDPTSQANVIEDEDETLILKDRVQPRDAGAAAAPPKPDDIKMTAERLSDNKFDDETSPTLEAADRVITTRADFEPRPPVYEHHPPPQTIPYEKQGEGRDTLKPDQ